MIAIALAFLGLGHYWRRQYDSAAAWTDSAIAVDPAYLLGRVTMGQVEVERGDYSRARAAFDAARRVTGDIEALNATAGAALVEARRGNAAESDRLLKRAESLATTYTPVPQHTAILLAHVHAARGEPGTAIAWLARVAPREDLHFQLHLRCDPPLDPLADVPLFRELLLEERPAGGC
jgi:tetratricopeptide (TPR) repeat protein